LALSPDGKWALSRLTSPSRLVLLPTGIGTAKTLKGAGLTYIDQASWTPDSRRIVFLAHGTDSPPRVYVQDTEGGEPRPVGPAGSRPIVAPDGRTVAEVTESGPVLFSLDAPGTRACPGLDVGEKPIAWSLDGRWLFVSRPRPMMVEIHRVELSSGRRNLVWSVAIQDRAGVRAVRGVDSLVTPDGKYYAYSFERVLSDLYLIEGLK
jgi:eukaryotic-like serine/threonine-protein kinase